MFTTRPEIRGTFGVVASTHWLASSAGMAILERGGNAFDAAVAAGFVLQIVEPHLNGPGGDLPLIMHSAKENRTRVICGQGPAPQNATIPAIRDLGLDLIPGSGLLAAVTPGAFDAWMLMLRDHGTMGLGQVMEYAIGYARNGYPVVPKITDTVNTVRDLFLNEWKSSAAIYLKDGKAPVPGGMFSNPKLADTYERIVRESEAGGGSREVQIDRARDIWYRGWIAESIDRFFRDAYMDATGRRHKGLLTGDDLAGWSATYEDPLAYDYGRYTVMKPGAWSQGPVLLQQLSLLKAMGLADMDPTGPDFVHAVTETSKLSYADREAYYGDPNFVDVPMDVLLSDAYAESRRALVGKEASDAFFAGTIEGYSNNIAFTLEPHAADISGAGLGVGEPTVGKMGEAKGDTVHIDIIDKDGNMVSATPSGGWLQSSPIIPELGFCLGNRAQMFWLEEGSPSTLAPGKRPRTTLSPCFALRDGEAYMPFGTPGGDQQDQWSLLLFLHHAEHGMNLQEAIDCPAFHNEHFPSSFWPRGRTEKRLVVEGRFPEETVNELRRRGHDVEVGEDWSEGRLTAAAKDGDMLRAAANPRGMQGYAVGR
ncbi:MAG: gamma-glutamyltransferase family protein [Nisaea sp.]|uniref:gamma-glutamyltransferase family protein n=1 Tax=Nisaea sp. TaxID=2024842 RepID=UPI001B1A1CAF|nr:gamma-glutamyltransferase family protein [Nisaea sp.]MBO6561125.1 gamma-glutamyltransferase family protein [Nisaea sp.]